MKWEFAFLDYLQSLLKCDFSDAFFSFITHLGDKGFIWIALCIVCLAFKNSRKIGVCIALSLIFGAILGNLTLKPLIARVRPYDAISDIGLIISAPKDFSFPSGHTLSSFSSAVSIFIYNKKYGTAALILAFLISFSRLYLYVHFPTDVIAGAVLGIALAISAHFCTSRIFNKLDKHIGE